jgi:tyrosine-protein kinase Etk/Wzc
MGPIQSFAELAAFLRRRRDMIVAIIGMGVLATIFIALTTPATYQSFAVLSARLDTVTADTGQAGANTPARLLQLVEQRLTTRENMLALADQFDMFPDLTPQRRVTEMRGSVSFLSQAAVQIGFADDGIVSAIVIQARADGAQKAADLANELAAQVMVETGAGREGRARETLEFLRSRQADLTAQAAALTNQQRALEVANPDMMPFQIELRRSELGQIAASLQVLQGELAAAQAELASGVAQGIPPRRAITLREALTLREAEIARLQARQAELEPFFARVAEVERERTTLQQAEDRLRDQIRDIANQVSTAEANLRLESSQQVAAYELVETAIPGDSPVSRSRRSTVVMGLVGSAVMGTLMAFGLELARPALRSVGQMERETGMRPVLALPELVLPSERRRLVVARMAGAALFLLGLVAAVILRLSG